jgi:response regulator RpfG family c-di-GMP phosphodiesterase
MHVLTWLRDRGVLSSGDYEGVLHHAQRTGERIEEAILDTQALSEAELLKHLASLYGTRFVSTERLAKATIDERTLARIPRELAERLQAFPVLFDRKTQTLSVVVRAPGEDDVEKQIQVVSGVREVRSYVARPAAVAAAIAKFYRRDARAFADLARRQMPELDGFDVFDATPLGGPSSPGLEPPGGDFADPFTSLVGPAPADEPAAPPIEPSPAARAPAAGPAPMPIATPGTIPGDLPSPEPRVALDAYHETLSVLVTLLERDRGELRGHSGQVARLCRRVAERVGLSAADRHALLVAAHLHDVGKTSGSYHLTALNVARYEGHRLRAQKSRLAPVKLFEAASLPEGTAKILAHLYERFDGQGFPDRLAGKDIPYGARVLALAETYADLTANPRNPYRRVLSAPQALSVLRDLGGQLFDPTLADLLVHLAAGGAGEDATGTRPRALVVDPDPEETTVLEMRLLEHGFAVTVARDLGGARERLAEGADVVVTEVDLGSGTDGFSLAERIGEMPEAERPAVIFLTTRSDRDTVSRGFELGAIDILVKPASAEVVATKAGQALEGATRQRVGGVSGSLKEMSLPDVVQILSNGRRGGRLQITAGARRGEIHFSEGQIHEARFAGKTGEEAFYALLKLQEGTFHLDPGASAPERAIHVSTEGLLLEGMRRLDEGLV